VRAVLFTSLVILVSPVTTIIRELTSLHLAFASW